MPLQYDDLEAGDLVLCYGWNGTAKAQQTTKVLARVGGVLTFPISGPIYLARLAAGTTTRWGTAECNHAIVVGLPENEEHRYFFDVFDDVDPAPAPRLRIEGDEVTVFFSSGGMEAPADVTGICQSVGQRPIGLRLQNRVVSLRFANPVEPRGVRLCHSTGGGCTWVPAGAYFPGHEGRMVVYRLRDPLVRDTLGLRAARVATTWAWEWGTQPFSQYSMRKATFSIFGSGNYGPAAQARAKKYRAHRDTQGGPPSDMKWGLSGNKTGKKEWFCSMFAVACYQAATDHDDQVRAFLPLDAKHTTPMLLDGFVSKSRHWTRVGEVPA